MKLKYYLRGLGIGILVTALILTIAPGDKEVLSDAQIRERALQLGMVDGNSLTLADVQAGTNKGDSQETEESQHAGESQTPEPETSQSPLPTEAPAPTESQEPAKSPEPSATPEPTESPEPSATPEPTESLEPSATPEPTESPEPTKSSAPATGESITITINPGASSESVARDLEKAGLVESARAFDTYLCDNGYSTIISVGTYEIAPGTSEEEIAKIITKKR